MQLSKEDISLLLVSVNRYIQTIKETLPHYPEKQYPGTNAVLADELALVTDLRERLLATP